MKAFGGLVGMSKDVSCPMKALFLPEILGMVWGQLGGEYEGFTRTRLPPWGSGRPSFGSSLSDQKHSIKALRP